MACSCTHRYTVAPIVRSQMGFYIKSYTQGSFEQAYDFDGIIQSGAVNQILENMFIRMGKWAYCGNCDKPLYEWRGKQQTKNN